MFCVFSPVWDQLSADSMSVARPPLFWLYFEIWIKMALYCKRAIFFGKSLFLMLVGHLRADSVCLARSQLLWPAALKTCQASNSSSYNCTNPHVANLPGPWLGEIRKSLEENRILYFINDSWSEFHSCNIEDKGRQWTLTEDGYINRFCNPPDPQRESWWMTTCDNASLTRAQK